MTDLVLHAFARVLLRVCSPARAHDILRRAGALARPYRDSAQMRRAAARIGRRGTCLSRALALAARAPDADLVIGVAPRAGEGLFAHAWIEVGGQPLDAAEPTGGVIARLRGRTP